MDINDDVLTLITTIASALTAIAAVAAAFYLRKELGELTTDAQTTFEDDLSREYRAIVASLPMEAFYVDGSPLLRKMGAFYRYFDLSNQQLFLAKKGRVSPATFEEWEEGIVGNMQLPAFAAAWKDLAEHLPENYFKPLRDLLDEKRPAAPIKSSRYETRF
jgi:hypothetical protein